MYQVLESNIYKKSKQFTLVYVWVWNWGAKNQRQERIRSWQTAVCINHTSVLAKADFFHIQLCFFFLSIQLANSNIVKTSDLFRKEDLAEVEMLEVKTWIRWTTGETGFHSILFASFYPGEEPSGTLVEISSLASRERSQQVSRGNLGGNLQKYRPILQRVMTSGNSSFCLLTNHFILSYEDGTIEQPF